MRLPFLGETANVHEAIQDEATRPPMLDEAVLNKATRPPMLDEAFKIETVKNKA